MARSYRLLTMRASSARSGRPGAHDIQSLILVRDVRVAARVDEHVFALRHQGGGEDTETLDRVGRKEEAHFTHVVRIRSVVEAEPGVEMGDVRQVVGMEELRQPVVVMLVVRSGPTTAPAEARI